MNYGVTPWLFRLLLMYISGTGRGCSSPDDVRVAIPACESASIRLRAECLVWARL